MGASEAKNIEGENPMASRAVLPIIRLARSGDAHSQFQLGRLYLEGGHGLGANAATAYLWLARAAAQGCEDAWRLIGERIPAEAAGSDRQVIRWYELAAEQGCVPAQVKLGKLLLARAQADGAENTMERALALLRSAAWAGDAEARFELGRCLLQAKRNGIGDLSACRLLEHAYAQGRREAARLLADHYWETRNLDLAHLWYGRCVDLSEPETCFRMGLLSSMLGLPGAHLLERAAGAGHLPACEELGFRYAVGGAAGGEGTRRLKRAVRWLERATALGSAKACFILAMLYRHPTSSLRDRKKARLWLFEAARAGHGEAALRAAQTILKDLAAGRAPSPAEIGPDDPDVVAVRFLVEARRQGYAQAASLLDDILGKARGPRGTDEEGWRRLMAVVARKDERLAVRLRLGGALGLTTRELLLIDPCRADRGDCFVVDFRALRLQPRRRIILVETPGQRAAIDEAQHLLGEGDGSPANWAREYRARYRRLRRLCRRAGLTQVLFPRGEYDDARFAMEPAGKKTASV